MALRSSDKRAAEDHFFGVQDLACVIRRAMLGAAPAFHAGEGLERLDSGNIFPRYQTEILVTGELRYVAESGRFRKIAAGLRTRCRCFV